MTRVLGRLQSVRAYLAVLFGTTVFFVIAAQVVVIPLDWLRGVAHDIPTGWLLAAMLVVFSIAFGVVLEALLLELILAASFAWLTVVATTMIAFGTVRYLLRRIIEYPGGIAVTVSLSLLAVGTLLMQLCG